MDVPQPLFIHYGFNGGACCSCILDISGSPYLVVGTTTGLCKLYSTSTHLSIADVYDDEQKRSIISVGQIEQNVLFVHVRSHAVLFLRFTAVGQDITFAVEKTILTNHYGFCRTIAAHSRVYIPLYNDPTNTINMVNYDESERRYDVVIGDGKSHGMLMSLNFLESAPSNEGFLICCFEKGTIAVFGFQTASVLCSVQAFSETIFSSAVSQSLISVASVSNKIKFFLFDASTTSLTEERSVSFPSEAGGCAAVCFSPYGKFIASGFWDGSIRVHSVKSLKIRAAINFHDSIINFLDWCTVNEKRLLFANCKDGSLSVWNLLKD